jgi:hypothetical protein
MRSCVLNEAGCLNIKSEDEGAAAQSADTGHDTAANVSRHPTKLGTQQAGR